MVIERIDRYEIWLDQAEQRIAELLDDPTDPEQEPLDLRALGSAIMLLRRIIDIRRILEDWKAHDRERASSTADETDAEEIHRLMEGGLAGEEDPDDEEPMP